MDRKNAIKFQRLSDKKRVNIDDYVVNYLIDNPDTKIYVGCDSQNFRKKTIYATVIVLHRSNNGGHVLYMREKIPKIKDNFHKLWGEVQRSMDVASYLRNELGVDVNQVDLDLNPDPKYKSNQVLRAAVGFVESMGFKPRFKPEELWAISVADSLCR